MYINYQVNLFDNDDKSGMIKIDIENIVINV